MASTKEELSKILEENDQMEALEAAGWIHVFTVDNKGLAMWQLCVHEVILKRKIALDQFRMGLKVLNFHLLLQHHGKELEPYFVAGETPTLTADIVLAQFSNINEESDDRNEVARQFFKKSVRELDKKGSFFISLLSQDPKVGIA